MSKTEVDNTFRETVVSMLNMLGDRSERCTVLVKHGHCEGCEADSWYAWSEGLLSLGYKDTRAGWQQMMRDNYPEFPTDEEIEHAQRS